MPALSVRGLTCEYDGRAVLEDVSFEVPPGGFVAVVGPSGCGKTTLLRALLGLHRPSRGEVSCPRPVGYVPQVELVDWSFPVTVEETLSMACAGRGPWLSRRERAEVDGMLERLGLGGVARRHVQQLSGGQQRRVFLGRALLARPQVLLLDEPTSGADVATRGDLLGLLTELNRDGTTIVLSSHELGAVATHVPWTLCLNRRVVAFGPSDQVLNADTLSETFGASLMVHRQGDVLLIGEHR